MSAFRDLKDLCPILAHYLEAAEEAMDSGPAIALKKLAEWEYLLIQVLLAFEGVDEPQNGSASPLMNRLTNKGLLPTALVPFFQVLSSSEVPAELPETAIGMRAKRSLKIAARLAIWLVKSYGPHLPPTVSSASTNIDEPKNLQKIINEISKLDWYSAREEGLGDLYEGLLQKNADEKKSGAGQYFTPRTLINAMVQLVQPQLGERCGDPACGTFGFMIVADQYLKAKYDDYFDLTTEKQSFQRREAFSGIELVRDAHRLALMNAMLHDIEGEIGHADALSSDGKVFRDYDVILTNPPFGTKRGGERPTRDDLTYPSSNKQLNFLQMIYRALKTDGKARAAVVLPDNVLFADGDGQKIRADLMDKCNLHTILRLPTGIFYAQGVKTNVLFFTRGQKDKANTKKVWVYDMRTNMPRFGKRTPLTLDHFKDFITVYGQSPYGRSKRKDQGETARFRCFTRDQINKRSDSLDITWLQDDSVRNGDDLPEPADIAEEILSQLDLATKEMQELARLLGEAG